ncbi:MAG: retropepsin-like aspartic protease [Gemmatimonadota bacterium]|nr:retropepsin-like aspartic protease [Gemmatimonadota bacterium]
MSIAYRESTIEIPQVLVDTGSASTVISADLVDSIGIFPLPDDRIVTIRGVGGSEVVFRRRVDFLQVGEKKLTNFELEVGGMDYGFEINGILGMDFLVEAKAIINLHTMSLTFDS